MGESALCSAWGTRRLGRGSSEGFRVPRQEHQVCHNRACGGVLRHGNGQVPRWELEDNLVGIFNLFDADGNKIITLNELYEIMAVFIEIGEGKEHSIDLAKTMAEMFKVADRNKDDVMDLKEFQTGVMEHPVTAKIFRIKKIDALLDIMAV